MNKLYILTAITVASLSLVSAQESGSAVKKPVPPGVTANMRQNMEQGQMPPQMMTGDADVDAQIKALNAEMEAKIKAIRDEYLTKIKAIVGDKKPVMASTTPRGMMEGKKNGMDEGKKLVRPFMQKGEVKGDSVGPEGEGVGSKLQSFLRGFFGGSN